MRYVFFAFVALGGFMVWMNHTDDGAIFKRHLYAAGRANPTD